jgi:hypothetical protein
MKSLRVQARELEIHTVCQLRQILEIFQQVIELPANLEEGVTQARTLYRQIRAGRRQMEERVLRTVQNQVLEEATMAAVTRAVAVAENIERAAKRCLRLLRTLHKDKVKNVENRTLLFAYLERHVAFARSTIDNLEQAENHLSLAWEIESRLGLDEQAYKKSMSARH